jgi:hypothetical protein
MNITGEEMQDLLILLQVAYSDATEMQNKSHDHEEIEAYEDHKRELNTWITRLRKEVSA